MLCTIGNGVSSSLWYAVFSEYTSELYLRLRILLLLVPAGHIRLSPPCHHPIQACPLAGEKKTGGFSPLVAREK